MVARVITALPEGLEPMVEPVARAICIARGLEPDTLFQTHGFPTEPTTDSIDTLGRTFSKCWRKSEPVARAAILAFLNAALDAGVAREAYSYDDEQGEMVFIDLKQAHTAQVPDSLIIRTGP